MLVIFIYLFVILPRYRGSSRLIAHTHRRKYCEKHPWKKLWNFWEPWLYIPWITFCICGVRRCKLVNKKKTRRKTNMKNVKVILISVALCATVFANSRISALGGDAGFWAGDRANVGSFQPAMNQSLNTLARFAQGPRIQGTSVRNGTINAPRPTISASGIPLPTLPPPPSTTTV